MILQKNDKHRVLKSGFTAGALASLSSLVIIGIFAFTYTNFTSNEQIFSIKFWLDFVGAFLLINLPFFALWLIVAAIFSSLSVPKDISRLEQSKYFFKSSSISFITVFLLTTIIMILLHKLLRYLVTYFILH